MKVGHLGDLHLTAGPRFADTLRVLEWIAADGAQAGVDLWLVGGDLVGTHDVPHVATAGERLGLARVFTAMARTAPVVILYGNHCDPTDIELYGMLEGVHPITVVTKPRVLVRAGAHIICVPFPHRRDWLPQAGEGHVTEQNQGAADRLFAWIADTLRQLPEDGPAILAGHVNVVGSRTSGDEILSGHEVELSAEQLDSLQCDYIALSHIHLHQKVAERAWYAGSPTAQTFGELEQKGYVIATVEDGEPPLIDFRPTPARRLVTVSARWDGANFELDADDVPAGAEVKVRVEIPEEYAGMCPTDVLEQRFAVAHSVVIERKLVPAVRVRSEAIQHARTNAERLAAWWETLGAQAPDADTRARLLEKLAQLEQRAAGVEAERTQEAA